MTEPSAPINPEPFAAPAQVPPPYVPSAASATQAPPPYVQQGYQHAQASTGMMPPPAYQQPAPPTQSFRTEDGRPTAMALSLPGAAGRDMGLFNMDRARPYVMVDGRKLTPSLLSGDISIPMTDGKSGALKVRATIPGFPKVTFKGERIYTSPKPPALVSFTYWFAAVAAIIVTAVAMGIIGGALGAFAMQAMAPWIANPKSRTLAAWILIPAASIVWALMILAIVAAFTYQ